ncbi:hypothetical protein Mgra_00009015 [Meloidogyne graminicola]|uniref:Microprocessor complex subunit DGCR8 n=1 Tax=Meloidogyne graminicola TaxID=189291 RepID=A0A8S9ZE79_9BILA|nr:hypothetical protein Mgra_00009015 [Meloidogyne graminicola]
MMDTDNSDNEESFTVDELEQLEQMRNALLAELNVDEDKLVYEGNEEEGINDFSNSVEVMNTSQINSDSINVNEDTQQNETLIDGELIQEEEDDDSNSEEDDFEREFSENIDNLLEEPIKEGEKTPKHLAKRLKRVLEYRANDHFNVLPDGWVEITHASGLPVYLHKPTRVCTFSRPYFIGRCSIRRHKVPESAITCLYQKKYQDEIEASLKEAEHPSVINNEEEDKDFRDQSSNNNISAKLITPGVRVKTELDQRKMQLTADQLYEYAKNHFKFKEICVYRFGKWTEARNFYKRRKMRQLLVGGEEMENGKIKTNFKTREERPGLPSGVKLITVPSLEIDSKPNKRIFYLNPQGKTSVSILHEFVQKALKCTVRYFFSETRSSATPYHCSVKLVINNSQPTPQYTGRKRFHNRHQQQQQPTAESVRQKLALMHEDFSNINSNPQSTDNEIIESGDKGSVDVSSDSEFVILGEGFGAGKKQAKMIAAKAAVDKLVPGIEFDSDGIACNSNSNNENANNNTSTSINLNETANCSSIVAGSSTGSLNNSIDVNTDSHIFDMIGITDTRIPELCARAAFFALT